MITDNNVRLYHKNLIIIVWMVTQMKVEKKKWRMTQLLEFKFTIFFTKSWVYGVYLNQLNIGI